MERRFWEGRPYAASSACSSEFPGSPMCSWLCDSDLSSSEEKPFRCGRFFPTAEMPRGGRTGSEGGFQWVASWEVAFLDEGLEVTLRQDTACPRSPALPPSRCLRMCRQASGYLHQARPRTSPLASPHQAVLDTGLAPWGNRSWRARDAVEEACEPCKGLPSLPYRRI